MTEMPYVEILSSPLSRRASSVRKSWGKAGLEAKGSRKASSAPASLVTSACGTRPRTRATMGAEGTACCSALTTVRE